MTEVATIEERYSSASHAGNLKVLDGEKIGHAEVLMAAGMSPRRLGAALIRLHSEYDGAGVRRGPVSETDLRLLCGQLRTLPEVKTALFAQAVSWGIEDAEKVAAAALYWWLDKTCHACGGHGKKKIKDSPGLSNIPCKACHGTGERKLAYGRAAMRLVTYMDDCRARAVQSIRGRLHGVRK